MSKVEGIVTTVITLAIAGCITLFALTSCNNYASLQRACIEQGGIYTNAGGCMWSREGETP